MKLNSFHSVRKGDAPAVETHIFAQLSKVDVVNRIVFGRAVQEVPDATGEIFDYVTSKPYFERWVEETKEATKGKSLGNIRAMHGNTAAGKAVEVTFHDDERAIDIAAKVVDDNEWEKVLEGVYTGFSIGGAYIGEKRKDGDLMRYTAAPVEISLVDKPCIPTAMFFDVVKSKGFTVVKADGIEEKREFKLEAKAPTVHKADADDGGTEIEGTAEEVAAFGALIKSDGWSLGKVMSLVKAAVKAEAPKRFADDANKKYPLDNDPQVLAAWYFVNTAKAAELYSADELKAIKATVLEAFKERFSKEPEAVDATKAQAALDLQKSFWGVASAADMLRQLSYFLEDMRYYEDSGAISTASLGKVVQCVKSMGEVIAEMIAVESASLEGVERAQVDSMVKAASMLSKATGGDISAADAKKLAKKVQKAHDMMVELGAQCAAAAKADDGTLLKSLQTTFKVDSAEGVVKAIAGLQADIEKIKAQPLPSKAVLKVVSKSSDTGGTVPPGTMEELLNGLEPVMGADGKVDVAATTIKALHRAQAMSARP